MILNLLKFNIISLNLCVIIWSNLCFNAYRRDLETSYQVPENLQFNRIIFLFGLNSYINTISFITIILNIGINRSQRLNTLINFTLGIVLGSIDYKQFDSCDTQCRDLLSKNNLYKANILAEYLSVFQMSICLIYFWIGIIYLFERKKETPLTLNPLYTDRLESPLPPDSPIYNDSEYPPLFPIHTTNSKSKRLTLL